VNPMRLYNLRRQPLSSVRAEQTVPNTLCFDNCSSKSSKSATIVCRLPWRPALCDRMLSCHHHRATQNCPALSLSQTPTQSADGQNGESGMNGLGPVRLKCEVPMVSYAGYALASSFVVSSADALKALKSHLAMHPPCICVHTSIGALLTCEHSPLHRRH